MVEEIALLIQVTDPDFNVVSIKDIVYSQPQSACTTKDICFYTSTHLPIVPRPVDSLNAGPVVSPADLSLYCCLRMNGEGLGQVRIVGKQVIVECAGQIS